MALPRMPGLSPAGASLGLGDALSQQVSDENEEARKKRLAREQELKLLGPAAMALGLGGLGG